MTTTSYSIRNDPLLLAGPVCILLSLAIATQQTTLHTTYFPSIALIGLCLCWKLALRGLAISLLFTAAFICFANPLTFWDLGIYLSLACAWLAVALAVEQTQLTPSAIPEPAAPPPHLPPPHLPPPQLPTPPAPQVVASPTSLPADLELIAQQQGELRAQQSLLERMRKLLTENELKFSSALQETVHHRQEAQKYKGLHDQLREQFEAKAELLNDTRQKLFQAEAQLEAACNELKEAECEGKTPWLKNLEDLLEHSEQMHAEQLEQLRRENQLLEEVIEKISN